MFGADLNEPHSYPTRPPLLGRSKARDVKGGRGALDSPLSLIAEISSVWTTA